MKQSDERLLWCAGLFVAFIVGAAVRADYPNTGAAPKAAMVDAPAPSVTVTPSATPTRRSSHTPAASPSPEGTPFDMPYRPGENHVEFSRKPGPAGTLDVETCWFGAVAGDLCNLDRIDCAADTVQSLAEADSLALLRSHPYRHNLPPHRPIDPRVIDQQLIGWVCGHGKQAPPAPPSWTTPLARPTPFALPHDPERTWIEVGRRLAPPLDTDLDLDLCSQPTGAVRSAGRACFTERADCADRSLWRLREAASPEALSRTEPDFLHNRTERITDPNSPEWDRLSRVCPAKG